MDNRRPFEDFPALYAYLVERYEDVNNFASEFLSFRVVKDGETTSIKLRRHVEEPPWYYFMVKVCRESEVDPRAVLHRSGVTPIGELSLFGNVMLLGQRVPLAGLCPETVDTIVDALVSERAVLMKELVKNEGSDDSALYSHLIE